MKPLPVYTPSVGSSSPQVVSNDIDRWTKSAARVVDGGLELASMDERGTKMPGNIFSETVSVSFVAANTDTLALHSLGLGADQCIPLLGADYASFRVGSKPRSEKGIYLQSDTAGVTGRFLIFGVRKR
jgi:hypothetical protein